MARFRKRPVEVDAIQFINDASTYHLLNWINRGLRRNGSDRSAYWENDKLIIPTLEGDHAAKYGDWIIKGVHGEFYPCDAEIFAKTYEVVEDD